MKTTAHKTLCTIMAVISAAIFTGCGNSANESKDLLISKTIDTINSTIGISNNTIDYSNIEGEDGKIIVDNIDFEKIPDEFSDIEKTVYTDLPTIHAITIEELYAFNIDQIRAFVSIYAPDYRTMYGIKKDLEMDDTAWNNLRALIGYELFGTIRNPNADNLMDTIENVSEDSFLNNAITNVENYSEETDNTEYVDELKKELSYITGMKNEEFIIYINDVFSKTGYNDNIINFDGLSEEQIEEMRQNLIKEINAEINKYQDIINSKK